jgi:ElaB/YqjD/DUF883 family membrane-anchored ribosome-binding protein
MAQRRKGVTLRSLREEIRAVSEDVAALAAALGEAASDDARARLESVRQRTNTLADSVGQATSTRLSALEQVVEENPIGSVTVALMFGFIVGAVTRR